MKKINKFSKYKIFIPILILLIVFYFTFIVKNNSNFVPISSKELNLHIMVPSHYKVTQEFHTLKISNQKDEIVISTYGSFYNNLESHFRDLSKKNNVKIDVMQKYNDNFYKVKFNHSYNQRPEDITYIILNGYTIHTFTANSEELYSDLDAIAKSFRYNP